MSEQKPRHEVEGIVCKAQRQDCVKAQIWGRLPKTFCSIEILKNLMVTKRAPEFLCGDGRTFQKDNHFFSTPPIRPLW
jgi:hypothetical protein